MLEKTQPLIRLTNFRWIGVITSFIKVTQME
ncbi:hypothetical protein A2U01_0104665, partial [Trifolium medium]|nr:hypothetical protein [Trifolium medium]